ncbi:CRISPR-associated protein, Cas6-related [Myxococcus xanthus DK 1622]|uniref:CRISPR-associated protein, Cas6-related n=1 Tax=Myxococcus xanthus (strain DK1622) TaxID=246197 RepID=Q1CW34_MYXXD|nr:MULTISPECIES: type I-MYXAN CRISPR-associated protein Cas6/Cmx6 [Myxococcus]ABF90866.1 CRISPR-associated protein, Cas6-related [Myxococcus xanthus DK 1622]NOJ51725.1 type I-MYXAN CRISPR-associated protein Cas6/Cmx6 [Myxococcus xanthus]QPM79527.1 type I-MYXAN CRISPR-associated protein Cas6/Cmx6 [Myxococcus xanthus]QVW68607.1 type I-MYXAN CRISPR-associated protein Cas6/Cmx6 [Myxococcus xanthus DZ2]QZZ54876.1 CRISPR-associated endonuclease Cas6 [Myxococcus xanthus]
MTSLDLLYPVRGGPVPLDHGYALFSALCTRVPALHERLDLGVFTLRGERAVGDLLHLGRGTLRLRCSPEVVPLLLSLPLTPLNVAGREVVLGAPVLRALEPASSLFARIVTFKHALDAASFLRGVSRSLEALACDARPVLGRRRLVRIAGKRVVGYALELHGVSGEDSLRVQAQGLGGRRHMGCGLFLPPRPVVRGVVPQLGELARAA